MASRAQPPSGGGYDALAVAVLIETTFREFEDSVDGSYRIPPEGRAAILDFAGNHFDEIAGRAQNVGIDSEEFAQQIVSLTREFLQMVRWDAQNSGSLRLTSDGRRELPSDMIERNLPSFVASRCLCWPQ
ncbi:hypothetical protein GCM10009087_18670 [Sphingomonas oligophenolica]|uniref:Uncharacterized protein n=1 Tax=Sphingomonas oligophenolica TaxID=301154 RepID=A0ABU9Y389_9SPHN